MAMLTYRFSPTKGDLELDYDGQQQAETTAATPMADKPAATGIKAGERQNALNALTKAGLIQKAGEPGLTDLQLRTLLGMDAIQNKDGDFELYGKGQDKPDIILHKNGCVGVRNAGPVDSPEQIKLLLQGAEIYKSAHPDAKVYINYKNDLERDVIEYSSKLAGLDVQNKSGRDLEKTNPELAAKIRKEWMDMGGKIPEAPAVAPTFSPKAAPGIEPLQQPQTPAKEELFGLKETRDMLDYSPTSETVNGTTVEMKYDKIGGNMTFDQTTLQNSSVAQFLSGKNIKEISLDELKEFVEHQKDKGFNDFDRAAIKAFQNEYESKNEPFPHKVGGVVQMYGISEEGYRAATDRWNRACTKLDDISAATGNPQTRFQTSALTESLKEIPGEKPDLDKFKKLNEIRRNPSGLDELPPELRKELENFANGMGRASSGITGTDRIGIETRSGLVSPVQGGLSCKFDGCATGAPQPTLEKDIAPTPQNRLPTAQL